MERKLLLLGDQAIAQGALDAGIAGVYAYPGTPSTEITEYIQQHAPSGVHSDWCVNEKTAMEAALGVSYVGRRALVCMKHVGLNVAADAFINSAMTGANGGLVVVSADDPSMHSSQNEQDSRFYGKFAFTPILEPSSQQEAYEMMEYAFALSERVRLPVLIRITTRLAHSRAVVTRREEPSGHDTALRFPASPSDWILLPVNARRRYRELLAAHDALRDTPSPYNSFIPGTDNSVGIIACGIAYNYLIECFEGDCPHPIVRIGQYPFQEDLIRYISDACYQVLVLEDGQPVVEERVRGIFGAKCPVAGRLSGEVPRVGELTPDIVREALGLEAPTSAAPAANVVARPPALCAGCGHRDVYNALNEVLTEFTDAKVFSDIGCYTLGALPPFRAIDTCVDMGASITMAKGAADAGLQTAVAVIGDSTFTHSGMTGLLDAVNSHSAITVIISDNLTTAMTGGQDSPGTGRLEAICAGLGTEPSHLHVVVPLPGNMEQIKGVIRNELNYSGVSVIIPRRECIQTAKKKKKQ